jgi:uncharacterized protein YbjQ (UPF0145 family)
VGGKLKGMTKALVEMGGNWTEICAYGTAVRARRV